MAVFRQDLCSALQSALIKMVDVRKLRKMIEAGAEPNPFMAATYADQAIDDAIARALREVGSLGSSGAEASRVLHLIHLEKAFLACSVADTLLGWPDGRSRAREEAIRWLRVGAVAFEDAIRAEHDDHALLSLGATYKFLAELGEPFRSEALDNLNLAARCNSAEVRSGALSALHDMPSN